MYKRPMRKFGLIAWLWTVLLVLGLLGGAAGAAGDIKNESVKVRHVPLIKGYPAGSTTPLFFLIRFPSGQKAASGQKSLEVHMEPLQGLKPVAFKLLTREEEKDPRTAGIGILRMELKVDANMPPGPNRFAGRVGITLASGQQVGVPFAAQLEILPQGQKPIVVNPEMLQALLEHQDGTGASTTSDSPGSEASPADDAFRGQSTWWIILAVFIGGLLLNLTPCVYPLIPITVSFFGGRAQGSKGVLAANALTYWAGLVITYTVLGAFIALSGRMLGEALTSPWVTLFIAGVLLAMAASMFGFWEIRLPAALNRFASTNRAGMWGTLFMGLALGLLAAPCVGPFVVALMTHVAQVGRVDYGLLLFFVLSLGLGLPLTVLAFFSGAVTRLPGAGDWMVWVRAFFGVVLVLMAVYVGRPFLGDEVFSWVLALSAAAGGIYLGFIHKGGKASFITFKRIAGVLIVAAAAGFLFLYSPLMRPAPGEGITWNKFSTQALSQASQQGKPVMVDIAADWCNPCKQMEANTFPDAKVVQAARGFVALRMDVTKGPSPQDKPFMNKWRVRGVPTIIFLDKKGRWMPELTIVGYVGPGVLSDRLKIAKARSDKAD